MTTIEQKEGYTIIDRRGGEACRVCLHPTDCHSKEYNKPTMECIQYLRSEVTKLQDKLAGLDHVARSGG